MVKRGIAREHPAHRTARMLVLDMFTTLPFLQPWLRHMGEVRACPENGARLLERDELVGVFPEGVKGVGKLFRDRYRLARFGRGGFVRLALQTGAPIIPVTVVGAEEIHPNLTRMDFIGKPLGLPYFPLTPHVPAPRPARRPAAADEVVDRHRQADRVRPRARGRRPPDDRERARGPGALDAPDDDRLAPRAPRKRLHGRVTPGRNLLPSRSYLLGRVTGRGRFAGRIAIAITLFAGSHARSAGNPRISASRATGSITVDGSLDDPGWQGAAEIRDFFEISPGDNTPPKVKTTAWITYDDRFFYVAIRCDDPRPRDIRAQYVERDHVFSDQDFAGIMLDTRNDGRTATRVLRQPLRHPGRLRPRRGRREREQRGRGP